MKKNLARLNRLVLALLLYLGAHTDPGITQSYQRLCVALALRRHGTKSAKHSSTNSSTVHL